MKTPEPTLTYNFWGDGPSGEGLIGERDDVAIFKVKKVTVYRRYDGKSPLDNLTVTVEGSMRKKDGTRGQHDRCLWVKIGVTQPMWLQRLVIDARPRLGAQ